MGEGGKGCGGMEGVEGWEGWKLRRTYHVEERVYHSSLDSVNASQVRMLYSKPKAVAEAVVNIITARNSWRGLPSCQARLRWLDQ